LRPRSFIYNVLCLATFIPGIKFPSHLSLYFHRLANLTTRNRKSKLPKAFRAMAITTILRRSCTFAFLTLTLIQNVASSSLANLDDFKTLAAEHHPVADTSRYLRNESTTFQNVTRLSRRNNTDPEDDFHRFHDIEHGFTSRLNLTDPFEAWDKYQLAEPFPFWSKNIRSVMESNTSEWFLLFLDNYAKDDSFQCRPRGLSQ